MKIHEIEIIQPGKIDETEVVPKELHNFEKTQRKILENRGFQIQFSILEVKFPWSEVGWVV